VDIEYADSRMKKTLESSLLIGKRYGHIRNKLEIRLSELQMAECLADITPEPPPRRHKLKGDKADCWGVDVSKNWRIVIKPIGEFDLEDLATITQIQIVSIEDYH